MKLKKPRNKFEQKLYQQLEKAKVPFKYESTRIPYVIAGHYIPDFIIDTVRGKVYLEAKGYFRPEHKRKMAAVKRQHPEIDLRILFYTKRPADIRWAEKHQIRWAISAIPQEWIEGL